MTFTLNLFSSKVRITIRRQIDAKSTNFARHVTCKLIKENCYISRMRAVILPHWLATFSPHGHADRTGDQDMQLDEFSINGSANYTNDERKLVIS